MTSNYGLLIQEKDILLHRQYFLECAKMIGVNILHRAPRNDKSYTRYGEIDSNYYEPESTPSIFVEFPDQKTMRKLGWNAELQENASIISVPYDLRGLQKGSLFEIPSAFDNAKPRLFRVVEISAIMIYPASLTCKVIPEFENTFSRNQLEHSTSSFNLLKRED